MHAGMCTLRLQKLWLIQSTAGFLGWSSQHGAPCKHVPLIVGIMLIKHYPSHLLTIKDGECTLSHNVKAVPGVTLAEHHAALAEPDSAHRAGKLPQLPL